MPDDLPFDETDLDMEDELEYNRGGVVEAANGTYVAPTVPTGSQPLGTNPIGNPMGVPQQVTDGVSGSTQGTPYVPNVGKMYGAGATPYAPVSYNQLLGPSATGAPTTETVRYFNAATGQSRMIPHLVNADGTRGATLYPVPEGFVIQEEAPKEEAKKTTQVQSTKVAPVDTGNDSQDIEEREREEAMYGRGAGRISLGGEIKPGTTVKTGFLGKGTSSLTKKSTTFGISYDFPGGVLPGIATIKAITAGTGNLPDDATGKFTLGGITITKSAEVTNAIIKNPMGDIAKSFIKEHEQARKAAQGLISSGLSRRDAIKITEGFYGGTEASKATIKEAVEEAVKTDKGFLGLGGDDSVDMDKFNNLPDPVKEAYYEESDNREEDKSTTSSTPTSFTPTTGMFDSDDSDEQQSYDSPSDDGGYDTGGGYSVSDDDFSGFNTGGLAGKKKKKQKPKKMKRGGLASR